MMLAYGSHYLPFLELHQGEYGLSVDLYRQLSVCESSRELGVGPQGCRYPAKCRP